MVKKDKAKGSRADRRNASTSYKPFYLAIGAIVVVGLAALGYALTRPVESGVTTIDPNMPLPPATGRILGDTTAPVEVIEFADMQCPVCADFALITGPDVKQRLVDGGQIYIRFMHFPLAMHRNAWNAANATECAADGGRFWAMHDRVFAGQLEWSEERDPQRTFRKYAKEVGVDEAAWERCYESREKYPKIQAELKEGERRQVNATPTFIIGRRKVPGNLSYDRFKAYVDSALAEASLKDSAAAAAADARSTKGARRSGP